VIAAEADEQLRRPSKKVPVPLMLVDDKVANLLALEAVLDSEKYELVVAGSGRDAIQLLERRDFAVVLLDIQMPIMDGFETASRMKRIARRDWPVPIIFVTGIDGAPSQVMRAYAEGGVDFIQKPFEPEILRAKVAIFAELFRARQRLVAEQISVAELKQAEERLREALTLRDDFISIASHELRTPLTVMLWEMEVLERSAAKNNSHPQVAKVASAFIRQVHRLNRLVEDMLDASRISVGTLSIDPHKEELGAIVHAVVERLGSTLESAGCAVRLDVEAGLTVRVDRFRMEQVVANLLTNVVKYAPGKPVEIDVFQQGERAGVLRVRDFGIGIPEAALPHIFERFVRAVPHTQITGLGLGLYIVDHVVRLHGGRIEVQSEQGKGSTFTVTMPLVGASGSLPNTP
jgi:signal transduction histidine kinase